MSQQIIRLMAEWLTLALGAWVGIGMPFGPQSEPVLAVEVVVEAPTTGLPTADLPATALPAPDPPIPVLLVPGWGDQAVSLVPLRRRFTAAGWPESRVSILSFSDPVGSNASHAADIDRAVRVLRGLTGEARVDIVAHSMGGLATRQFLLDGDEAIAVRRAVFLGTPHRGSVAAVLSWGEGGREMVPGSAFLTRLNGERAVPEGVRALSVRTPVDSRVIPASSSILHGEGVFNMELCCPTHTALVDDDRTFREVLAFLLANGLHQKARGP
jgi:triacylglycerol lipase